MKRRMTSLHVRLSVAKSPTRDVVVAAYDPAVRTKPGIDGLPTNVGFWHLADMPSHSPDVRFRGVHSTGQCNTSRSLSAGVSKPKVFRGR